MLSSNLSPNYNSINLSYKITYAFNIKDLYIVSYVYNLP